MPRIRSLLRSRLTFVLILTVVGFPATSLGEDRRFVGFKEDHERCQAIDVEFSISATVRGQTRKVLSSSDEDIVVESYCDPESSVSWMSLGFPENYAVMVFNFSTDGNKVYLKRSFIFRAQEMFPGESLESEMVTFEDPDVLELGGIKNSDRWSNGHDKAAYQRAKPGDPGNNDPVYSVEVDTASLRVQTFGSDQPTADGDDECGKDVKIDPDDGPDPDTKQEHFDARLAAIVGSLFGFAILALLIASVFIFRKRRREYDQIDDD